MKKNIWLPISLVAILVALVAFEPSYGWKMRDFFARMPDSNQDQDALALKNQALQAQIAELRAVQSQMPEKPPEYIRAMVYSRYPLNFKNELLIDIGRNEGVASSVAVAFQGALVGKIERAFSDTALVETIFDNRLQIPVRVGSSGIDALLSGGSLPRVTLLPLKAAVNQGDVVYSASPDFPYGLAIGTIGDIKMSPDQLFNEATVDFAYDINSLETVLVAKSASVR